MKLLNPNLGETIDRLTILERKIVEGRRQGKLVGAFRQEAARLYEYIKTTGFSTGFLPQILQLAALNAAIWDATALMSTAIANDSQKAIAENGQAIYQWNNERAAIVQELSGAPDKEKL